MIDAIILAAGESRRMGQLKPLLRFEDGTFLGRIISVLKTSDVDRITVVLGANAEIIEDSIDFSGTNVVTNKDYRRGQLSSLITAIENTPQETQAILICLVDNPFITKAVVDEIINKFKETDSPIIVPVFSGRRGHPTLFSRPLFNELLSAPEEEGARYVLYSNAERVLQLETPESAILISIDTPEDYRSQFGTDP